jgi:hypothetical protein
MPRLLRATRVLLVSLGCAAGLAACGSAGPSGATTAADQGRLVKFASCMRASGVPNFPDPGVGGGLLIRPGSGVNPGSPAFQAAQKRCARFAPARFRGPGTPTSAQVRKGLAFARCLRAHGLTNFPDPLTAPPSRHGLIIDLGGMMFAPGPGFDPRSAAFHRAASRCGVRLPSP